MEPCIMKNDHYIMLVTVSRFIIHQAWCTDAKLWSNIQLDSALTYLFLQIGATTQIDISLSI